MAKNDFSTEHLSGKAKEIADGIVQWMTDRYQEAPDGGGCKAFYSPEEWEDRGESYGLRSQLVLVHDGGDLAPLCNPDYECWKDLDAFSNFLQEKFGVYVEPCTGWYAAVYPV